MQKNDIKDMLIEYMGKGFLENIAALFKQDVSMYQFIPDLLGSENLRVRLGAAALIEELAESYRDKLKTAVPGILLLLKHENPTIRGDAAYALGIIKDPSAVESLRDCLHDDNRGVREVVKGALEEINGKQSSGPEIRWNIGKHHADEK